MRKIIYFDKYHNSSADIEIPRLSRFRLACNLQIGGDDGSRLFTFGLSIPYLFMFFFTLRLWGCYNWLSCGGRNTGFYIDREMFHVEIWQRLFEWDKGDLYFSWLLPSFISGMR